jgi:hypothetical protein
MASLTQRSLVKSSQNGKNQKLRRLLSRNQLRNRSPFRFQILFHSQSRSNLHPSLSPHSFARHSPSGGRCRNVRGVTSALHLLELQGHDTALTQLHHRRGHLPEHLQLDEADQMIAKNHQRNGR